MKISSTGDVAWSIQLYYDLIPLYKNGVYRLKYDISSTVDRTVDGMIQQNSGTYQAYTSKKLSLTPKPQTVAYEFTMDADTDIMARLQFNCGNYEENLPEHMIYIDNVSLELIDDSKVDYSGFKKYEPSIVTNQVGYHTNAVKTAAFTDAADENTFSVINADTGKNCLGNTAQRLCGRCTVRFFVGLYRNFEGILSYVKKFLCKMTENMYPKGTSFGRSR